MIPPRYKDAERDQVRSETRQSLLEAAAEKFAREGYHRANINSISQSAGYAKGTIYNYFESKRALMLDLIKDTAKLHLGYITDRVQQEEKADKRLEYFFEAGFEFVTKYLARGRAIVNNLYGPDTGFKEEMYKAYMPMFELVGREIIALGISQGIFRKVDLPSMANLVMLIYLGVASQVDAKGLPWIEARQVADFALHALRMRNEPL